MHITIYVNKKNAELFQLEAEKSKLINNLLERHYFDTVEGGKTQDDIHAEIKAQHEALVDAKVPKVGRYVGTPDGKIHGPTTEVFVPRPPDPETGYPCCQGKRPCKHWVWDGNLSAYVNSLTGKEREVL